MYRQKMPLDVSKTAYRKIGRKLCIFIVLTLATYIKATGNNTSGLTPIILSPTHINDSATTTTNTTITESTSTTTAANSTAATTTSAPTGKRTCIKAAIEQFPSPIIGPTGRKYGGILIYIAICVYSFLGLAIVCDKYFVKSLNRICEELKLSSDVAGATFMAAGSSAPELATVIIGVFLAQDDIGISGVIGSAVFNVMFVIAMCGLFATTALYLNWWPLCRDCFFYYISIIIMLVAIANESINWFESVLLLVTYVIYCIALYYNESLEKWVETIPPFNKLKPAFADQGPVIEEAAIDVNNVPNYSATSNTVMIEPSNDSEISQPATQWHPQLYKPQESKEPKKNPLEFPTNASQLELFYWRIVYPIHYLSEKTIPDCESEQYHNWYAATFVVSMIWISFYSYIMVWMITIIGYTLGIPDTVMGLTFVAAGVSVPDALSSIAVVKEGYGDMAVSNAVGSNVFDILVCLGVPWFLQTAVFHPGRNITVYSKGLTYSTISLFSTVVILIFTTHMNGWKLDKKSGVMLLIGYFVFITVASLYELNVFGDMNPPVCESKY